jgi:parvulin-like peptidyl-prolyl isomerase
MGYHPPRACAGRQHAAVRRLTPFEDPPATMTSRPKTSSRARTWDERERRNMLLNIGFGLVIVAALLLLLIAWGVSWYNDHLSPVASVNGTSITRDQWSKQVDINQFRADYQLRRIRTQLAEGHIGAADAETRQAVIDQRVGQIDALSLEQLIDGTLQASLAAEQGVTVTDADVDAQLTQEATTPELRHAWVIEVKPEVAQGATSPTDEAVAAARATADQALADLKSGGDWETIAKAVSTADSKEQAGDLGFVDENTALDAAFRDAILAVPQDTPTDVIEGSDRVFRIGRVTEIVAPVEDPTFAQQVSDAGISMDDFREALRRDATRVKLNDAIVAQYLAPGPQREVSELFVQNSPNETGDGAVRVRHILYSPNNDPQGALDLPQDDPAWAAAEAEADATYEKLKTDPGLFDSIARAESDDTSAATNGGKLGYVANDGTMVQAFADAIFQPDLQPGQILEPVRTEYGWHVIQIMHYPTDQEWVAGLKTKIESGELTFADAARDNSDLAEAADGGYIGWVGKGQLDETREQAIFAAPIGKVSDPLEIAGQGIYLFFVQKEETREPDAAQKAALETSAFSMWYSKEKAAAEITRDPQITSAV